MSREIERKWIINCIEMPEYELLEETNVEQAYSSVNPELRIRNKGGVSFTLTMKDNGTINRMEIWLSITEEQYREILDEAIGKQPIRKRYRKYRLPDGLILEVSEVDDGAFSYAEV